MMKWPVVWAALLLVASGESADPPNTVGEHSVAQLKEFISQAVAEALPLHSNCTDHPDASDCDAVVENGLCTREEFYARFCCRSCTLARQIPTYGPHLRHEAKAPLTSVIVSSRSENISCVVSGFPTPHVAWFRDGVDVSRLELHEQKTEDLGGVLVKKLRSDLLVRSAPFNESTFNCMAINDKGFASSIARVGDKLQVEVLPKVPIFRSNETATLQCIVTGRNIGRITWVLYGYSGNTPVEEKDGYNITETRTTMDGITTAINAVTFLPERKCFACSVDGLNYDEKSKCVTTSDASPLCEDTIASSMCYVDQYKCSRRYHFPHFCCQTCAKLLNPSPRVSVPDLEIVQGRAMLTADDVVTFECISRIAEASDVTWAIDDQDIEDSEMYRIEDIGWVTHSLPIIRSKLSILLQKVEHNGKVLRCSVKQRGATISTNITVVTSYPPEVSIRADQTNPYGGETRLRCMAYGYPDLTVAWFRDGNRIEESSSYHIEEYQNCSPGECNTSSFLVIRRVTVDLLGNYLCSASNAVGASEIGGTLALTESGTTDWIRN